MPCKYETISHKKNNILMIIEKKSLPKYNMQKTKHSKPMLYNSR